MTIESLMSEHGIPGFRYIKMDIEGAELQVFRSPTVGQWLTHAEEVMVEVHERAFVGCAAAVQGALGGAGFEVVSRTDDKEHWKRRRPEAA